MSGRHLSRLAKLEARYRQAIQPDIDEAIRREMGAADIAALEAEAAGEGIDAEIAREMLAALKAGNAAALEAAIRRELDAKAARIVAGRTSNTQAKPPDTGQGAPG